MARTNRYDHFCPVARSLEVIGEKWSLLIVRDLLPGPRRFSDLQQGLRNITPKWLTLRLRELEAAGLVERDWQEGRREVWYQLTPAGLELQPVISSLNVWGTRHAIRSPMPGEAMNARRMLTAFAGYLNGVGVMAPPGTAWRFSFGEEHQEMKFSGGRWRRMSVSAPALTVATSTANWAAMLAREQPPTEALHVEGDPRERARFLGVIEEILAQPALTLG